MNSSSSFTVTFVPVHSTKYSFEVPLNSGPEAEKSPEDSPTSHGEEVILPYGNGVPDTEPHPVVM